MGQENNLSDRIVHMILPLAVIVTEHLWYYGYMVRNKMLDEVRADYVLLCEGKGNEKSDHDHTLSEKCYAVVSEYYGNFRSTYYGWNVCGGDCFFPIRDRHAGI